MASYQPHFLTPSGERLSTRDLEAETDEGAAERGEAIRVSAMELWAGERHIKRWYTFPPGE